MTCLAGVVLADRELAAAPARSPSLATGSIAVAVAGRRPGCRCRALVGRSRGVRRQLALGVTRVDQVVGLSSRTPDEQNSKRGTSIGLCHHVLWRHAHKRLTRHRHPREDLCPIPREDPAPQENPPPASQALSRVSSVSRSTITCTSGCCSRSLRVQSWEWSRRASRLSSNRWPTPSSSSSGCSSPRSSSQRSW